MSPKNLLSTYSALREAVDKRRLSKGFACLESMIAASNAHWNVRREADNLQQSYDLLKQYALSGAEDPQRHDLLEEIASGMLHVAEGIIRQSQIQDSPKQYFSVIRYEDLQNDSDLNLLIEKYVSLQSDITGMIFANANIDKAKVQSLRDEADSLQKRIFNLIWTAYPLGSGNLETLRACFANDAIPETFKVQMVSAVMLGLIEYFDADRIELLANLYLKSTRAVEVRALCCLMIGLWLHRESVTGRRLKNVMNLVFEKDGFGSDLKMVFLEFAKTRDTERVSKSLKEEIIPSMLKIRPDIMKRMSDNNEMSEMMSIEENPEWEDLMEKSGLTKKLRELSELQEDGADVLMSTFSNLKGYPFFRDIPNWFLPFDTDSQDVARILESSAQDLGEIISLSPMICDSDKYSIVFSLEHIPAANRRMMLSQFNLQNINLAELHSSELNPEHQTRKNICNKYIQDLYRFFNLYRRKSEFRNPFSSPLNLAAVKILSPFFDDSDMLTAVGEFYFKRGYYEEAISIFSILMERSDAGPDLYQKCAYSYQKTGDIDKALDLYLKSELARPDGLWNLRRIAQCYKLKGDNEKALEYYSRVADKKPDDVGIAINIGHCLLELGRYSEAMKCCFKAEFLDPDSNKSLRPLAWCLFVTGDLKRSNDYYNRIIANNPTALDYLNYGHLQMAMKQYRDAANSYILSKQAGNTADDAFLKQIRDDRPHLLNAGVDPDIIDIVSDMVTGA